MITVRLAMLEDAEDIARETSSIQHLHNEALPSSSNTTFHRSVSTTEARYVHSGLEQHCRGRGRPSGAIASLNSWNVPAFSKRSERSSTPEPAGVASLRP
jgi:hypothetical protein